MCFIVFGSYILGATLSDNEALLDAGARALPRVETGEGDMGENAAATPAKARTRIVRRICYVTRLLPSCVHAVQDNNPAPDAEHDHLTILCVRSE